MIEIQYDRKNRAKIKCDNLAYFDLIREKFTVPNPAKRYSLSAPDELSPITPLGTFNVGLSVDVIKTIRELFPDESLSISKELLNAIRPMTIVNYYRMPSDSKFQYRNYQELSIKKVLSLGRGVLLLPTSAGKSLIAYGILRSILNEYPNWNILILVPNLQLVRQLHDDFIEYGMEKKWVQHFSSFKPTLGNERIIISNRQWLEEHGHELPKINAVIVDECIRKGQKVTCKRGNIKIENVRIGDMALSYNEMSKKYEFKKVLKTFSNLLKSNSYRSFIKITLENNKTLSVTPNHEILTQRGWIRADELNIEDEVFCV